MELAGDAPQPKTSNHARHASHAKPQATSRPRSSTKGPLEAADSPLDQSLNQASPPQTLSPPASTSPLPSVGKNARDLPPIPPEVHKQEFGQLLSEDIFHPLSQIDVPIAFREALLDHLEGKSIADLLSQGCFRAAAVLAANQLTLNTSKTDHARIFSLFYVRLACLQILGLHAYAAQEVKALQDLDDPIYRDPYTKSHLIPWELRVLAIRLQAIGFNDWRRGVMAYYDLAQEARYEFAQCSPDDQQLWKIRLSDLGIRVGNALVEMGDFDGAIRHLKSLPGSSHDDMSRLRLALVYLRIGAVTAAKECIRKPEDELEETTYVDQIIRPLCTMASGKYDEAAEEWSRIQEFYPDDTLIALNKAACMVYCGRVSEARAHLEQLLDEHEYDRGIIFNLSTIYELCSDQAHSLKLELTEKAASQEPSALGWERSNADFKL